MILQFLTAFILVVFTQAVVYHLLALRGLTYSCSITHSRIFEGENNQLTEVIENRKLLPLLWLRIETRFSETMLFTKNDNTNVRAGVFHRSVTSMQPFRRIKRVYKIVCTKRGYYRLGAATVTTGDLIGLANKSIAYKSEAELHVYPIALKPSLLNFPARSFLGDTIVKRFFLPDPFLPAGIRDYSNTDPQKLINWKASAKTGKLVVQRHDFTSDSNLLVFFNTDYSSGSWDNSTPQKTDTLENMLRVLAAILDMSILRGQKTALYTNAISECDGREVFVTSASGRNQREKLYMAMAEIKFVRTRSFHSLIRETASIIKDEDVLIMTRYVSDEIITECNNLRKAGNKVEIFIVPDSLTERRGAGV